MPVSFNLFGNFTHTKYLISPSKTYSWTKMGFYGAYTRGATLVDKLDPEFLEPPSYKPLNYQMECYQFNAYTVCMS
jgi:hypothetical protein